MLHEYNKRVGSDIDPRDRGADQFTVVLIGAGSGHSLPECGRNGGLDLGRGNTMDGARQFFAALHKA